MSDTYTCPECGHSRVHLESRLIGINRIRTVHWWECSRCDARGRNRDSRDEAVAELHRRHAEQHDAWLPDLLRDIRSIHMGVLPDGDHVPTHVVEWASNWVVRISQQGTAPTATELSKIIGAIPDAPTREEMYGEEQDDE